jgi:hypothetical protein
VPLEKIFDRNDVHVKPIVLPKYDNSEECNIGTKKEPKLKIIKRFVYKRILQLFKEYMDVFPGNMKT